MNKTEKVVTEKVESEMISFRLYIRGYNALQL